MSTRSSARNLFPPLDNPELTIQRRSRVDPTLLNDFEMATDGNGDPLVPDLHTMEEWCQPTLNGWGRPIAPIAIQATNFRLKNDMIKQVQNSCQFHRLLGDDANKHLDKFLHVTRSIKVNGVTDDALRLNEITNFRQCPDGSLFEAWELYKLPIDCYPNHNMLPVTQIDTFYNGLTLRHRDTINVVAGETFMIRRPDECYDLIENMTAHHNDWDTSPPLAKLRTYMLREPIINLKTNMTSLKNSNLELKNMFGQFMKMNTTSSLGSGTLPSNTITNPKEDLKGITTQSGNAYKGPKIPTTSSPKVVERETEVTKDTVPPTNNRSTKDVQPLVVQIETLIPNSEPVVAPVIEPIVSSVSVPKRNQKPSIPYPSRLYDQKLRDKANDQKEIFFQIFNNLDFNISFADALILIPNFGPTIKIGVAEDVFVKVGTFHFSADFVVVDFNANPKVPLILERSFLKIGCALIDVYDGELTLRIGKEVVTFNLDQTLRYSTNYDAMSVNRIGLIDVACEEYSQEVLGFSVSGNPTPSTEPIVSTSSSTLTPFEDSNFLLEETNDFLAIDDEPISPEIDESYYDSEGDILLLEEFLNDDPSSPPLPPQELKVVEPTNEKSSNDKPPVVELKDLPPHLEYAFLEGDVKLPIIIAKDLIDEEKTTLINVLKSHKQALAWQLSDIKGINLEFCTPKF
nr:reverse transcriptase domain-containing protein [Tanacetum cinerariifolium]